jgi:hypothetical protein
MTCYSVSHRHDYISCEALKENGLRWYGVNEKKGRVDWDAGGVG